ncbi:Domain unknown function DUF295 [Dillenia turbinata]|uniref:KIB1-4 beta-propeller domain-containing protein n=1 Tax=Dillenia turbinata TaxID=194707 RepID=A0AAN8VT82_9MAGN
MFSTNVMNNWSEPLPEILILIARKINSVQDFLSYGLVCKSWHLAAASAKFNKSKLPWLMLADNNNYTENTREFFDLSNYGIIQKLNLPEVKGRKCFSSHGWLITISDDLDITLLHPLSRREISLPNLDTLGLPDMLHIDFNASSCYFYKAILSSSPSRSSNYVVMLIHGTLLGQAQLAFCRAGDKYWTPIDKWFEHYSDVTHFENQFSAVDCEGNVVVFDVNGRHIVDFSVPEIFVENYVNRLYVVELTGKLMMVCRVIEGQRENYGTRKFEVFEIDLATGFRNRIKDLGNNSIFLGFNSSISVDCAIVNGCRPSCIYFTDDGEEPYHGPPPEAPLGRGKDMGIYDMMEGTVEPLPYFEGESYSRITPPMWV